jgi:enamine deaminase RidA (YjgF/YER057c/UK114 family)
LSADQLARAIQPAGWARARGYSNGMVAEGRLLAVGGQIGWNPQQVFERFDFVGQFEQTLANVRAVVEAAGGGVEHVVRMTVFVTDLPAYRASLAELGPVWRRQMGRHYPAMALVGVAGLVEPDALIEIQALAVLPEVP